MYLSDLLAIASAKAPGEAFALVNADVSLALNTDLSTKVMALQPGAFIFSRRLDIAYPGQVEGTPWHHGYDFFAGHTDDLAGLADAGLVFGAPWWDHFFPLLMHMQGCRIRQIEPAVVHLSHTERWSWSVWEALGQRFIAGIEACSTDETYRSRLDDALRGRSGRLLPDLRRNISMRLPKYAAGEAPRLLHRISELNVSFLDRVSLETV